MKLVGAQAHRFCKKPDPKIWAVLLFGNDNGVVADGAQALRLAFSDKTDDAETITLDQDHIRREPNILFDALEARSLLGNRRIIKINVSGDKISSLLLEAIALGEAHADRFEAKLIITAGALAKRSKLRAKMETCQHSAALQFFEDELTDIGARTRDKLSADGLEIEEEALALFIAELPGHRGLANQEMEKLALYGRGLGRALSSKDIRILSTSDIDHALHDLISATLAGQVHAAQSGLERITLAGTSPISILRALQRESNRLLLAHTLMGTGGGDIGMKLKPPVFKNKWPAFRATLALWSPKRLARVLERIHDAEAQIKTAGPIGAAIIQKLIGDLASAAERAK